MTNYSGTVVIITRTLERRIMGVQNRRRARRWSVASVRDPEAERTVAKNTRAFAEILRAGRPPKLRVGSSDGHLMMTNAERAARLDAKLQAIAAAQKIKLPGRFRARPGQSRRALRRPPVNPTVRVRRAPRAHGRRPIRAVRRRAAGSAARASDSGPLPPPPPRNLNNSSARDRS